MKKLEPSVFIKDYFYEGAEGDLPVIQNYFLGVVEKVFLNTLVATSWNAFAGDIAVKSRDAIKLHQEKYNANSVIPRNVLASDYLTDCHQALFFQQDTLVYFFLNNNKNQFFF